MEDREYVVTLRKKEDLEQFYNEMKLSNFPLVLKRPISRNTHYMMTEEQAERLRKDPRIVAVELVEGLQDQVCGVPFNNEPYTLSSDANLVGYYKPDFSGGNTSVSHTFTQWGFLHCIEPGGANGDVDSRKNAWGENSGASQVVFAGVGAEPTLFNAGKHVDIVIVDDGVASDSEDWKSPTTGESRFVEYQWFDILNQYVSSIDDDGYTLPTGSITYHTVANCPTYHGTHVASTAAGKFYGWAKEANIYSIPGVGGSTYASGQNINIMLRFDYLRAFHRHKPINEYTGKRNPTITNHSYGGIVFMPNKGTLENPNYRLDLADINYIVYRGSQYNASNPGPSGWTEAGIREDFGIIFGVATMQGWNSAVAADVEDAVEDGVVVVGAAGNDNMLIDKVDGPDWNNILSIVGGSTFYYNRGAWPNSPDSGSILVGNISHYQDFRRSASSCYGPGLDIFAPGSWIMGVFTDNGSRFDDLKYGSGQYYYPISGTSMASPQVAGVLACIASGKDRFSQYESRRYLKNTSAEGLIDFDLAGGGFTDVTCKKGTPNKTLRMKNPRVPFGLMGEQPKGKRPIVGQAFPRSPIFRNIPSASIPVTYSIDVNNSGSSDYLFNGKHRGPLFEDQLDPTVTLHAGDTIDFIVNASGHPFWIKTSATTGTGNGVTTGTITNNGTAVGTVTWDTTGVTPGTYYYICQYHSSMQGQIIIL